MPVHNRKDFTKQFVECLITQTYTNYHLVLIDDGSSDRTAEMVCEYLPNVTVLEGDGRLWWAGSLQLGIDWLNNNDIADDAIILFINDDVTYGPSFLESAVETIDNKNNFLLLAKISCDNGETIYESGVYADLKKLRFEVAKPGGEVNCLPTRGLFVRFVDIGKIGNFHPSILPHYLSDYEYTIRAIKKGMKYLSADTVYLCPDLNMTGHREYVDMHFWEFMSKYFTKKSTTNPIYFSVFVLLTVPGVWMLPNLMRVWYRAARLIMWQLVITIRRIV